jgi:hypothetical protein
MFMKLFKTKKSLWNIIFILIGLAILLLGGGTLLLYISMIGFSMFAGYKLRGLVQVIRDYKLALKINTLAFSQKQYEELLKERDALRADLQAVNERLKLQIAQKEVL